MENLHAQIRSSKTETESLREKLGTSRTEIEDLRRQLDEAVVSRQGLANAVESA